MKKLIFYSLFLPIISISANMTIEILNLKNQTGKINIGLYDKEESFPLINKAYRGFVINANQNIYKIENIPNGVYAIAIFHDENQNSKLDKNFFGIPKEGFGFSNNSLVSFSPPSFEKSKFELKNSINLKIKVVYK